MKNKRNPALTAGLVTCLLVLCASDPAFAYIGPGAGFAFLSSFLIFFLIFFLAILLFVTWPVRWAWRAIFRKRIRSDFKGRVVIVGLDGLDPERCRRMMEKGELVNFKRLSQNGSFHNLATTTPAISPVAWSSFQTGVNPALHNIFDFLTPDRKSYLPLLSSAYIGTSRKVLKVGKWRIPLGKPELRLNRKSRPFWAILGENSIFSSIIRVPITFPPEKFNGVLLSAMCAPDLRGTQGTFTYFTDDPAASSIYAGGTLANIKRNGNVITSMLAGPENTLRVEGGVMTVPLNVTLNGNGASIDLDGQKLDLKVGQSSEWLKIVFKPGLGIKVYGICRLFLKSIEPHFGLYVSPINIDPDKPALPISHPIYYSTYLAKIIGPYATLGLAEDTWALNERVLTEEAFLEQCWRHHGEREKMLFDAIEHTPDGCVVCVFDTTDRIQHMFSRYLEEDHPANKGKDAVAIHGSPLRSAIDDLYRRCDDLIGEVLEKIKENDFLIVMSDHGFKVFRRGVNLNSWLYREGYLALREGAVSSGEWFLRVDWSRTRAYALGLGGIYINRVGREKNGAVQPGEECRKLIAEIAGKLTGLKDPERGSVAISRVYPARESYAGPYIDNAPDLVVGCADGYRASWDGVTGVVNDVIFEDNVKSWSGDHCVDPDLVPGVFFCNRRTENEKPRIIDIAPTVLKIFGIEKPAYMNGEPIPLKMEKAL